MDASLSRATVRSDQMLSALCSSEATIRAMRPGVGGSKPGTTDRLRAGENLIILMPEGQP